MTRQDSTPGGVVREGDDATAAMIALGTPQLGRLVKEAARWIPSQPVASLVVAVVSATVCAVILGTTGQSAATERDIVASIDAAGARTIVISDPTGRAGLMAGGLDSMAQLPGVDWIVGFGPASDVRATALEGAGSRVAIRPVYPALPPAVIQSGGRAPGLNEAIAGGSAAAQLGLVEGAGSVTGTEFTGPVVGTFTAVEPLAHLNDSLLVVRAATSNMPLRSVHVVARSVHDVEPLERIVPRMLHVTQPLEVRVDSPAVLSDLQRVVQGVLGRSARQLMLILLGCGLVLIGLTVYATTATRRRDFGRRRALGASRSAILGLVLLSTGMVAGPAALLGASAGSLIVTMTGQSRPPLLFAFGVAILSLLAALAAAFPPAIAAALRDPVRILRVP